MGMTSEGTVYIPLADFWEFVAKYNDTKMSEVAYGVPRINTDNPHEMEIDFAASTEGHPMDWMEKPKAVKQWIDLKTQKGGI